MQGYGKSGNNLEESNLINLGTLVTIIIAGAIAIPLGYIERRIWQKCFTEFDRSMLIRLSEQGDEAHHPNQFHYVPAIVGAYPFSDLRGEVESNLDTRNVVGFVIDKVRWIDDPRQLGLDPCEYKPGYYAYCVIQWEHANQIKRYYRQGFGIRKIRIVRKSNPRENAFIGFGTDTPEGQTIAHWQDGPLASFRYQPYDRAGFKANDIRMRQLAPQTRTLIWLKNFITKEWDNAWR